MIVDEVFRVADETDSAMALGPNVVVIGSLSKTYGLPGLRLGWVAADKRRIRRLRTVQQYLTLSLGSMTVALGAAVLAAHGKFSRAQLIRKNRRILTDWAKKNANILAVSEPQGGTTVCLTVNKRLGEMKLFRQFLQLGVLLVPGTQNFDFVADVPWFRLGYATESRALRKGLEQISAVLR